MDELVRIAIKEIGLSGLSGAILSELWIHIQNEVNLRKEEIIPISLDDFVKGALWLDLLHSPHISHFETPNSISNDQPLLELSTIISDKTTGEGKFECLTNFVSFFADIFFSFVRITWCTRHTKEWVEYCGC